MAAAVHQPQTLALTNADAYLSLGSMEGVYETPFVHSLPKAQAKPVSRLWPGFLLAAGVAAMSFALHNAPFAPFAVGEAGSIRRPISDAIIAIVLGLLVRNLFPVGKLAAAGAKRTVRYALPASIVLSGASLNLQMIVDAGPGALAVIVTSIGVATFSSIWLGKRFGVSRGTSTLIGAGTAICGNSAIVAVAPLVEAKDEDLALSMATVNLCGLVSMLVLPAVALAAGATSQSAGILAGATVHSVPQALAAGFAFSPDAGTLATLVKLVRVTMLAPLVFLLAVLHARSIAKMAVIGDDGSFGDISAYQPKGAPSLALRYGKLVPWFVWGFAGVALLNTLGLFPTMTFSIDSLFGKIGGHEVSVGTAKIASEVAKLLLTLVMAAIGLELDLKLLARSGGPAMLTGIVATVLATAAAVVVLLIVT